MHPMHPPCRLCAVDTYNDDIVCDCFQLGQSDNCYQFKMSALLMYSRGGIPKDSLKPNDITMSCGVCLHSLILISQSVTSLLVSQSAISSQFRPHPNRLQKPQDTPCFLHFDSDQQKNNINCTQPLASSVCFQQDTVNHTCFSACYHPRHPR